MSFIRTDVARGRFFAEWEQYCASDYTTFGLFSYVHSKWLYISELYLLAEGKGHSGGRGRGREW